MKFKLTLDKTGIDCLLPISYQYELSAWIYRTIHYGNADFARWLHEHGYMDGKKQFKLFTFSKIHMGKYAVQGDRIEIQSPQVAFYTSFYAGEAAEPFIIGLFSNQQFSIGDKKSRVDFRVASIEKLPDPEWKATMQFRTISPVVISVRAEKHADYLSPEHPEFETYFIKNLVSKYMTVMKQSAGDAFSITFQANPVKFQLLSTPKPKVITIKTGTPSETKIKGYLFDFSLTAPPELLKLGYYAGFGEKNSLGFGSVEEWEK